MENKKKMSMTLVQKLYNVMASIDEIQKDKTNDFHKYNYASEYAIKKVVHEQLVKERILFKLEINSVTSIYKSSVNSNNESFKERDSTLIEVNYTFINVDDQSDGLTGQFFAEGKDSGDKGIYKAITGAIKYILTSTFLIPTGDDVENTSEPRKIGIPGRFGEDVDIPNTCSYCDVGITEVVKKYSIEKFKRALCIPCQKIAMEEEAGNDDHYK